MTSDEKCAVKQFNEAQKAISSFCGNASLAWFAGAIGLWYGDPEATSYVILGGMLAGLALLGMSIAGPFYMRPEE